MVLQMIRLLFKQLVMLLSLFQDLLLSQGL